MQSRGYWEVSSVEVSYAGRTITDEQLANAKFVLSTLAQSARKNMFSREITVDGVTVGVEDVENVLSLAQGMWFRLSQEGK